MKRFVLILALVALLGGAFAYLLNTKSSYVLLSYENHAFESSLWFFVIVLLLAYFVFNMVLAILRRLYRPGKRFEAWSLKRRIAASKRDFLQGLLDYETGAWDKALKKFRAAAANLERPLVAYLYAARAAQQLGREDVREEMLHEAAQAEPQMSMAVGLVRAQLLIDDNRVKEARDVLQKLQQASPSHPRVKALLAGLPAGEGLSSDKA